jgi:hypothetical protein
MQEAETLKPMLFPEEAIREELRQPDVTEANVQNILDKALARLDGGDFSQG